MHRIMDKMTNVVMNYSDVESKVREATNDDAWGPHGSLMAEIAKYSFTYEHYPEVMAMVWRRMFEGKKNWRRTYKSMLLLSYLLHNGSERAVSSAREHIYDMKPLEEYTFRDEHGKDQGINVRQKAKEILSFIADDERLREARKKAKENRDKYVGYSSTEAGRQYSDRYDQEPRSRPSTDRPRYDEDPRGPLESEYHDENGDVAEKKEGGYSDLPTSEQNEEEHTSLNQSAEEETPSQIQPSPVAAKKMFGQPSKLIDMGAAATFASQAGATSGPPAAAQKTSDPLLNVFGDFSSDTTTRQNTASQGASGGFADFESAFGSTPGPAQPSTVAPGSPGFGDFASFQSKQPAALQTTVVTQQPGFADFGAFQTTPLQPLQTTPHQPGLLQPQPMMSFQTQTTPPAAAKQSQLSPSLPQMQQASPSPSSSVWNTPGVNIDIDNLRITPVKTTAPAATPSMYQLAQTSSPGHPSYSAGQPGSFSSGPNYNINTAALIGGGPSQQQQQQPARVMPNMGMGPRPAMGYGMGMQQPAVYGGGTGMGPGYGGMRPVGMQQYPQQRPF